MEATVSVESVPADVSYPRWSVLTRIGFRFCFAYFLLFCLSNQIISSVLLIPMVYVPGFGTLPPIRAVVFWVGAHLFRMNLPLVYTGSGSGDKRYDWVLVFCLLVIAAVATVLWSVLDHRRNDYRKLHKWFLLFLRICLGGQMLVYGFIKFFPLQMPYPNLARLVEHFGDFSPMGVLWSFVGASPAYETVVGCAELLGGVLLMFPRTVTLGALVCLADMAQIFLLNMTYDVPVKLLSLHLIMVSLLLLGPEMDRLTNFFLLNKPVEPSSPAPLFSCRRAQRITAGVIAFLWIWLAANNAWNTWRSWQRFGPGAAQKSPLYGIWDIEDYTLEGKPQPLLVTNAQEWRGIVFDYPKYAEVQLMDDSRGFDVALNQQTHTVTLSPRGTKGWQARFSYTRPAFDRLTLDGTMGTQHASFHLRRVDEKKFMLETRGFHWVQDYPFGR